MRILIADDSLLSRRLLEETLLGWGYEVVVACDGNEAWQILCGETPPPVAILDWMMPGYTGPELCRLLRAKPGESYTYVLLLTSRNERDDVVEGLDSGADDYITKPFDRHELKVRLRAGTRIVELQEALRYQAKRDYLTHLWNRSAILEVLQKELLRSEREMTPLGVVLADLDHFKVINDTYGHCAGDLALQQAANRMRKSLREYDAIGRYGGEEFLAVLPGADLTVVGGLADRMRLAIRSEPVELGERRISLSSSFGCTSVFGGAADAAVLVRIADEALYTAKRNGRDRTVVLPVERPKAEPPTVAGPRMAAPEVAFSYARPESD